MGRAPEELSREERVRAVLLGPPRTVLPGFRRLTRRRVGIQPSPRVAALASDPTVKKVELDRVQCRTCVKWVHVGEDDGATAAWAKHRAACDASSSPSKTGYALNCSIQFDIY